MSWGLGFLPLPPPPVMRATSSAEYEDTAGSATDWFVCPLGLPQWGQVGATSETLPPQSGQTVSAIGHIPSLIVPNRCRKTEFYRNSCTFSIAKDFYQTAFTARNAGFRPVWSRSRYRWVVTRLECPRANRIASRLAPPSRAWVANQCLKL